MKAIDEPRLETGPVAWCADGDEALDYLFRRGRYAGPGTAPRRRSSCST